MTTNGQPQFKQTEKRRASNRADYDRHRDKRRAAQLSARWAKIDVVRQRDRIRKQKFRSAPDSRKKYLAQKRAQGRRRTESGAAYNSPSFLRRREADARTSATRAARAEQRKAERAARAVATIYRRRAREERAMTRHSQRRWKNTLQIVIWKAMKGRTPRDCGGDACKSKLRRCGTCACRDTTGLTPADLRANIASKFQPRMSFENYGEWEVDHVVPCAEFDFADPTQAAQCFHHSNLRPLWMSSNRRKWAHPAEKQLVLL